MKRIAAFAITLLLMSMPVYSNDTTAEIDAAAAKLMPKIIEWRRHIHRYPELSNREVKTAKYVEDHLRALGLEVRTGIAKTGVVGILKGGRPGPVIRSEEHTSELQSRENLVCRLLLEKKKI